jgi:hypothetical protein
MIHRVPAALASDLWPAIEQHAKAAMERHPFMDETDLLSLILQGYSCLFVAVADGHIRGFAATEVVTFPRCKVANIIACGGERGFLDTAIHEMLPELRKWGEEHTAKYLAILGARPGWLKPLRNEGGNAEKFVTWWTRLGNVQGRRQLQEYADHGRGTVERGTALPH